MTTEIEKSLERLTREIQSPEHLLGLKTWESLQKSIALPEDLFRFLESYGSGSFEDGGMFLSVLNPYEQEYWQKQNRDLQLLRDFKRTEREDYVPFGVYPDQPGLLLWGFGEGRKHFFWLTEGDPETWPTIVMYDIEIFTRFDLPMTVFLGRLLCGDFDCAFIGRAEPPENHLDPGSFRFVSRILPT